MQTFLPSGVSEGKHGFSEHFHKTLSLYLLRFNLRLISILTRTHGDDMAIMSISTFNSLVKRWNTSQYRSLMLLCCFQAVQLGSREVLLAFCEAVQRSSPVGSFTKPVAGATPGYASEVQTNLD